MANRSRANAPGYGELTLGGAELQQMKSPRIPGVTFDSKLRLICVKLLLKALVCVPCSEQESCLIIHMRPSAVSMFCQPGALCPCVDIIYGVSWVCWIVLFAVLKCFVRVSFVVWGSERRRVSCVCYMRLIAEQITL